MLAHGKLRSHTKRKHLMLSHFKINELIMQIIIPTIALENEFIEKM